jgi:MFS family permease
MLLGRVRRSSYAWVVVGASALMMAMSFGTLICVSVFLRPLEAEFGWDRGVTSFAYSSAAFMTGLIGIGMGRLVDRFSVRPILLVGALVLGTAQVLLSRIDAVWQLYVLYGLMVGGFGNAAFLIPLVTNVGYWFDRNRGLAFGVVMAGQSLGGALLPTLARGLLEQMAWRDAYLTLGLIAWAVLIPLALLVREPPGLAALKAEAQGQAASFPALISPARLTALLCMAIVMCCVCMAIPVIHVYPLAVEAGFAPSQAGLVLGVLMGVSIVGRVGIGRIGDMVGGIRALLLASGIQTALIFWFSQMNTLGGLLLIAVLFGVGYGGVVPAYAIIIRELIPLNRVGRSMGLVFFFGNLGMSLGGYLGGLLYDLSGGYPAAYAAGAVAGLVNLALVGTLLLQTRARQAPTPAVAS